MVWSRTNNPEPSVTADVGTLARPWLAARPCQPAHWSAPCPLASRVPWERGKAGYPSAPSGWQTNGLTASDLPTPPHPSIIGCLNQKHD